jgi:hypothetical protein
MGRQPKQDEPEDLPVTHFVAFGRKAKSRTSHVSILVFLFIAANESMRQLCHNLMISLLK